MLKIRLMGTEDEILWFKKQLKNNQELKIMEFSELYPIKGSNKYRRAYLEVNKINK